MCWHSDVSHWTDLNTPRILFKIISRSLESNYEIKFIRDFNVGTDKNSMKISYDINCLKTLIKVPTCLKNPDKPTCIDLTLTNRPNIFQHSSAFKTDLSDFHLPPFGSNWIQNRIWITKTKDSSLPRLWKSW